MIPYLPDELQVVVMNIKDPGKVTDLIASNLNISLEEKQDLLNTLDVRARLERLSTILNREIELLELGHKIQSQVQTELNKNQKEFYLRQQMKAIQRELGEGDARERRARRAAPASSTTRKLPAEARKAADSELERLRIIPPESAEHTRGPHLPRVARRPAVGDLDRGQPRPPPRPRQVLDEDHYDLEKIKDRILEYLAVRKLQAGPARPDPLLRRARRASARPRSAARSRARWGASSSASRSAACATRPRSAATAAPTSARCPAASSRACAAPARTTRSSCSTRSTSSARDFRGDPASALLEVLDPEQNNTFVGPLPRRAVRPLARCCSSPPPTTSTRSRRALRDRMEVIELAGYTEEEKLEIARRHLIPKQIGENGLTDENIALRATTAVAADHPQLHARGRAAEPRARDRPRLPQGRARRRRGPHRAGRHAPPQKVREFLGPERFFAEVAERTDEPGVATGLAWTPNGGDILFIEATRMAGKKGLTLTGQLGDVMKESAQAALSYVRSRADAARASRPTSSRTATSTSTCPAGAIPKDGPSAGVTMATALVVAADRAAGAPDLAMTGEITLRGKVLPVGGIKEKVLAARRAGIETVILPRRNEKDLEDVPAGVRETLRFHFVDTMDEVARPRARRPVRRPRGPARERLIDRRPPSPDQTAARPCPSCGRIRSSVAGSSSAPSASAVPPTSAPPASAPRRPLRAVRRATSARPRPRCWSTVTSRPTAAWRVRVVPSKFPALRVEGDLERRGHGLYDLMNGIGAHEVVIESPRHDDALARLPVAAVEDVVRAWRDRIVDLKRDQRFRAIMVFKAHAAGEGAALEHPALAAPRHADPAVRA